MNYNYNSLKENMKKMLIELRKKILSEYDAAADVGVRINLLPKAHNAMSGVEKVRSEWWPLLPEQIDEAKKRDIYEPYGDEYEQFLMELGYDPELYRSKIRRVLNPHNEHHDPANVVIHEATPGKTRFMKEGIYTENVERPTKPAYYGVDELYAESVTDEEREEMYKQNRSTEYYDRLIRNMGYNNGYGRTIGYHARIDYPMPQYQGMINKPEIVILMPATASPDQVANSNVTPFVYGIERCVGSEQNFHLAVATQAMLTAFVLKEMGYDNDTAMKHVFPHNFFTKNKEKKAGCPARSLYASYLTEQSKTRDLTEEEIADIEEYVPWEVYMGLVQSFLERDIYPEELQKKFIYDMSDYDAYMADPDAYDYRLRKVLKPTRARKALDIGGEEDKYPNPATLHVYEEPDMQNIKISKPEEER